MAFKQYFYYHPESDSLWGQTEPLDLEKSDSLVEEISYTEYLELQQKLKGLPMIPDSLDTRNIPPNQNPPGGHPVGMFDFQITNTYLKETKDKTGAMLAIEFTSPAGRIEKFYNLFNPSQQAVEIANQQLSALTHAINIYQVPFPKHQDGSPNMEMAGHSLRGGKGRMEVAYQKGQEPTTEKPSGGYVEVRKVFDAQGNEPGKGGAAPQTQPQQGNTGGWNAQPQQQQPQPQQQPAPQQNATAWSAGPSTQQPNQQQPQGQQSGKPAWAS